MDDKSNPKTRFGMTKPPLSLVPATAIIEESMAFADGEKKYSKANWRQYPVSASTYINAALRHIMQWYDGEDIDPSSGVSHLAHARSNLAILIDTKHCGTLIDDRPLPGAGANLIRELTKPLEDPTDGST